MSGTRGWWATDSVTGGIFSGTGVWKAVDACAKLSSMVRMWPTHLQSIELALALNVRCADHSLRCVLQRAGPDLNALVVRDVPHATIIDRGDVRVVHNRTEFLSISDERKALQEMTTCNGMEF